MGSKPTEIWKDGTKVWRNDMGQVHREDGPAVIDTFSEYWYKNGNLHREDGPAVIYPNGSEDWYFNGKLHREDGPAVINHNTQNSRYYLHGINVTDRILDWMERNGLHGDMTPDDMCIFLFEFDITEKTRQYNSNINHTWV